MFSIYGLTINKFLLYAFVKMLIQIKASVQNTVGGNDDY